MPWTSKTSGLCQWFVCSELSDHFWLCRVALTISRFLTWALWWKTFLWRFCIRHHRKDGKRVFLLSLHPWFAPFNSLYAKFHCFLRKRGFLSPRIVPGIPASIVIFDALVEKHEHSTDLPQNLLWSWLFLMLLINSLKESQLLEFSARTLWYSLLHSCKIFWSTACWLMVLYILIFYTEQSREREILWDIECLVCYHFYIVSPSGNFSFAEVYLTFFV